MIDVVTNSAHPLGLKFILGRTLANINLHVCAMGVWVSRKFLLVVMKSTRWRGPILLMPQVTDDVGYMSDAVMCSSEVIVVIPLSTSTPTLVATVLPLVLFLASPILEIGRRSPFGPMYSSLYHSKRVVFLATQVKITRWPGRANSSRTSELVTDTSCNAVTGERV